MGMSLPWLGPPGGRLPQNVSQVVEICVLLLAAVEKEWLPLHDCIPLNSQALNQILPFHRP